MYQNNSKYGALLDLDAHNCASLFVSCLNVVDRLSIHACRIPSQIALETDVQLYAIPVDTKVKHGDVESWVNAYVLVNYSITTEKNYTSVGTSPYQ